MTIGSQQHANLADHSYGRDLKGNEVNLQALVGKSVEIEGVRYKILNHVDKPSGYQGTIYQREDSGEIVVAHRGTEFGRQPLKDGVIADGGMAVARTQTQARDAIEFTREARDLAKEYGKDNGVRAPEVTVTGHSLGGVLAQITAHHFDLRGETFNSYGAASLQLKIGGTGESYRIPEQANPKVINHVMAADLVSSASPHYGQVRVYANQGEITQLKAAGYHQNRALDFVTSDHPILASVNTSHMMHNFLNVNGDHKPDVSVLRDNATRQRANDNAAAIGNYRGDVLTLRRAVSLGGDAGDIISGGPMAPLRAYEKVREALKDALPAGEPARREEGARRRVTALDVEPASPMAERFRADIPGLSLAKAEAMALQARQQTGVSDPAQLGIWVKGDNVVAYSQQFPQMRTDPMRPAELAPDLQATRDAALALEQAQAPQSPQRVMA